MKYLLDVNVLVALAEEDHTHHHRVLKWFRAAGRQDWGICALTEAGFVRVCLRPGGGARSVEEVTEMLIRLTSLTGFHYWPVSVAWTTVVGMFPGRIFGHQQITDAYLLALAATAKGTLVTFDRALKHMAGSEYQSHLLVLE
jgi:uncharacterized protein